MAVTRTTTSAKFYTGATATVPNGLVTAAPKVIMDTLEIRTDDLDVGDQWHLARLPSVARVYSIMTYNDDLDSNGTPTLALDFGLYDVGDLATATITITAFTELNGDGTAGSDNVNLIATDGTNYNFYCGDHSSVSGTWEATTSNDVTATSLMNVINTSSGPAGTRFTATVDGAVVTVTQAVYGSAGNTEVTITDSGTAGMTKTNFTGGGGGRGTGAVKDVNLFFDGATIGRSANEGTEVRFASALSSGGSDTTTMGKPLYTLVGDAERDVEFYDLQVTVAAASATAQAGTFSFAITYTDTSYPYKGAWSPE